MLSYIGKFSFYTRLYLRTRVCKDAYEDVFDALNKKSGQGLKSNRYDFSFNRLNRMKTFLKVLLLLDRVLVNSLVSFGEQFSKTRKFQLSEKVVIPITDETRFPLFFSVCIESPKVISHQIIIYSRGYI